MNKAKRFSCSSPAEDLQASEFSCASHAVIHDNTLFLDFAKAWFGTLQLSVPVSMRGKILRLWLGEKLGDDGRIDRQPPATIRARCIEQDVPADAEMLRVVIPVDERNTGRGAVLMPEHLFEVMPFRYAEIEDAADIDPDAVRLLAVHCPFNDDAAHFSCSDETLNAVWELCRHTIKATTFCGVYVDGDRERIPYEGDAYINQLCHYCVDQEYEFARYSHEYLIQHPTWPTEWQLHSVLMAWADYLYSGDTDSLALFYDDLQLKTLMSLAREDGLISTQSDHCDGAFEKRLHLYHDKYIFDGGLRDLVDWPPGSFTEGGTGERDNHEMLPVNTVVNAFHYHSCVLMANISGVLGRHDDQRHFSEHAAQVYQSFNAVLFDVGSGVYVDGEGSQHSSLHSNMFALAFGLVPEERRVKVLAFIKSRGMACSVYGAQYLLEALYEHGAAQHALDLMRSRSDRGWWNMIAAGSTMCLEAWDIKYKNNLDWNHAWGAVPANMIPRYLMGIRPLAPGFSEVLIQPQPGDLRRAALKHPTPLGPIELTIEQEPAVRLQVTLTLPEGCRAQLQLPESAQGITLNGRALSHEYERSDLQLEAGRHFIALEL